MGHLIGIFSVLWALLLGGVSESAFPDPHADGHSAVTLPASERITADNLPNKDMLLSSAQLLLTAGEEEESAPNVRPHPSNNRPNSLNKTDAHIVRNGKVLHLFRHLIHTTCDRGNSGAFAADRYLFALRRIRI